MWSHQTSAASAQWCWSLVPAASTSSLGFYCRQLHLKLPGHAIVQVVSRWLPTMVAQVRARVWSCGIHVGQSGAGAGFLRGLRFPLPIFISPIALQSPSSIIWGWYNRPVVAAVPSGVSLTPLQISNSQRVASKLHRLTLMLHRVTSKSSHVAHSSQPKSSCRFWVRCLIIALHHSAV
jgi:hypothetical protein